MRIKKLTIALMAVLSGCSNSQPTYTPVNKETNNGILLEEYRSQYSTTMNYAGEAWFDQHEIYSINEMPHRANFYYYDNEINAFSALASALDDNDHTSQRSYQSLNGVWYLHYASSPKERLRTFISSNSDDYYEDWDISTFDTVDLPFTLQTLTNDDGSFKYESPIYINNTYPWLNTEAIQYGWDGNVVAPTSFNSVSHLKRYFTVDQSHLNKTALLHIQGISSAYYVYINGKCIGYSEDSYTDSYYDISSYLLEGENSIALEVYRYCDGSYLENQDMIRLSGVFRDISIEYSDKQYIYDIVTHPSFDDEICLGVDLTINSDQEVLLPLTLTLQDSKGNEVIKETITVNLKKGNNTQSITLDDLSVDLWQVDDPNLYSLVVNLNDHCIAGLRVGFRELTWDDCYIYINGIQTELKGINRHEMDPFTGKVLSNQTIIDELSLIKASNINAIRMSHYPNNNLTYDIADELGLLLIDEANIESHGGEVELSIPGNNPIFIAEMKDRFESMVKRDRNHASVIIYSYGNESTYSTYPLDDNYGFYVLSQLALQLDDSRLRMYERDNRYGSTREESMVDIASSQYYSIDQMMDSAKEYKIPYLQQEYAHAMGNALGNFKEYHDSIIESECAGGFVWDFKDQSIVTTIDGIQVYGNGSDWNTPLNDGSFCGNGIVFANGTPQPELYDLKQVYQYVDIDFDNNQLIITNNYPTINLDQFVFEIRYLQDGNALYVQLITVDCIAGQSVTLDLDLPDNKGHSVLQVYMKDPLLSSNGWIAYQQFELSEQVSEIAPIESKGPLMMNETDSFITVSNGDNSNQVVINKESGSIESIIVNGNPIIAAGHELLLYRAPLDNDPALNVDVLKSSYLGKVTIQSIDTKDNLAIIQLKKTLNNLDVSYVVTYSINSEATIDIDTELKLGDYNTNGPITAIGFQTLVSDDYVSMEYYGNGETDHYVDRANGAAYGIYQQNINENTDYYLTPTTRNHKYDVSWLTLINDNNVIDLSFNQPISFTYTNPTNYLLATSSHDELIEHQESNALFIEAAHMGIGNGSYGPSALEQYTIKGNSTYRLKYQLSFK